MRKQNVEKLDAEISVQMIKEIIKDLKKFKTFDDFLVSVRAQGKEGKSYVAYKFPTEQMSLYESSFVNKYITDSLNDKFVFADKTVLKRTDNDGNVYKTNYFMPRIFWTHVLDRIKLGFDNK